MLARLNPLQHSIMSVLLLLFGAGGLYGLLLAPGELARRANSDRIEELTRDLSRHRTLARQLVELEQEILSLRATNPAGAPIWIADSPALAAAGLKRSLKALIESQGCQLISSQPIIEMSASPLPRVVVKISMRGDIESTLGLLYHAATERPGPVIDNLIVQSRDRVGQRPRSDTAGILAVQFDAVAYYRAREDTGQ